MLYTRFGIPVTIIAKHGKHEQKTRGDESETFFLNLVTIQYQDGDERYRFAESLRASKGLVEIVVAVEQAPFVPLDTSKFLEAAEAAK
jgi:hypothetical protein